MQICCGGAGKKWAWGAGVLDADLLGGAGKKWAWGAGVLGVQLGDLGSGVSQILQQLSSILPFGVCQ